MASPDLPERVPRRRATLALAGVHAALGLWALERWVHGPFGGRGILDGAEVLALARTGSAGAFETKSPLYPALLGPLIDLTGEVPWTVGLLGVALSVGTLLAIGASCRALGRAEAAVPAQALWAVSGSALVFAVQPLPVLLATLLLALGALALVRAREHGSPAAALAGALLAASAFTRAPLAVPAVLLVAHELWRGRRASVVPAAGGAALVALACFAAFGPRAWPSGSAFNLRQGNGPGRSGISDLRPGPRYDRARYEAAFAGVDVRGEAPAFEAYQRARLREEVLADVPGSLATLARKAFLFWHGVETPTAADFRHGLRGFPPLPLLLLSFALVAPLALASLLRRPPPEPWIAVLGVFAVNVVWLTSARYRFPALPFLCIAAGCFVASVRAEGAGAKRAWGLAVGLGVLLQLPLAGVPLLVPGDGLVQEGHARLAEDRGSRRAREALEEAVRVGRDPRARYDLALAYEADGRLEDAERLYSEAMELDPPYSQAGENRMALLLRAGRIDEARALGEALVASDPYAGGAWLNLAAIERRRGDAAFASELEARGHLVLALRALSQNEIARGRAHAERARAGGVDDPRLAPLFELPAR